MSDNNSNNVFDLVMLFFVFALFGGNGFGFGGGNAGNAAVTANQTADMITARETNSTVSANGMKLDAIAGIVSQNSANTESVKTAVYQGFTSLQKDMCEMGSALGGLLRDNKDATKDAYCGLSRQGERDTAAILAAVAAEGSKTRDKMDCIEMQKLKDENLALKGQLSQNAQSADLKEYAHSLFGCCKPGCSPCGTGYSGCGCSSQLTGISVQLANLQAAVDKIPTT